MQKARKTALKIPWSYWLSIGVFLVLTGGSIFLAVTGESKNDRGAGVAGSVIFCTLTLATIFWPIFRNNESNLVFTEFIHSFEMHCNAVVFPMSKAKQLVIIVAPIFLLIGLGGLLFFINENESKARAAFAFVVYLGIAICGLKFFFLGKKGFFLVHDGIVWNELFRAPCFIPWQNIEYSSHFFKNENGRKVSALGLNVRNPALVQTGKWTRKEIIKSRIRHGWHFYFLQETITFPLETVAQTVHFYYLHPEARAEIGTTNCLARIKGFELVNDKLTSVKN